MGWCVCVCVDGGDEVGTKYWEAFSQLGPQTRIRPKGSYWFRSATGCWTISLILFLMMMPELYEMC